jgi:hypothetical protein
MLSYKHRQAAGVFRSRVQKRRESRKWDRAPRPDSPSGAKLADELKECSKVVLPLGEFKRKDKR